MDKICAALPLYLLEHRMCNKSQSGRQQCETEREAGSRPRASIVSLARDLTRASLHSLGCLSPRLQQHDPRRLVTTTTRHLFALCKPTGEWKKNHWGEWTKSPTSSCATKATHTHTHIPRYIELRQLNITRPRPTRPPRHCPPWRRYTATTLIRISST